MTNDETIKQNVRTQKRITELSYFYYQLVCRVLYSNDPMCTRYVGRPQEYGQNVQLVKCQSECRWFNPRYKIFSFVQPLLIQAFLQTAGKAYLFKLLNRYQTVKICSNNNKILLEMFRHNYIYIKVLHENPLHSNVNRIYV